MGRNGDPDHRLAGATVGGLYRARAGSWIGIETAGLRVLRDRDDGTAGALSLVARQDLVWGRRWRVSALAAFGAIFATERLPAGGTRTNYIEQLGLGMGWSAAPAGALSLDLVLLHVSNGDRQGDSRNPGLDAVAVRLGWEWRP